MIKAKRSAINTHWRIMYKRAPEGSGWLTACFSDTRATARGVAKNLRENYPGTSVRVDRCIKRKKR